jgi:hypothetical protein
MCIMKIPILVKWTNLVVMESSWDQITNAMVAHLTVFLVLLSKFVLLVKMIMSLTGILTHVNLLKLYAWITVIIVLLLLSVTTVLKDTSLYNSVCSVKKFHQLFVMMVNTNTLILILI